MPVRLTDRLVQSIKPDPAGQRDHFDARLPGFALRVTPNACKSWIIMYRHRGRRRRFTLGAHPVLALGEARAQARLLLQQVAQGHDPAAAKQQERRAETFAELAALYLERHAKAKKKSWRTDERILERELLPAWGRRPAKEITRRDVRELLELMVDRNAPQSANRTFALIRKLFNFAVGRELVPTNPCLGLERPAPITQRDRVLTADEIRVLWNALELEPIAIRAIFRLYLLTAQRGGEIKTMRWQDLDLEAGVWNIPAERAKNALAHRVPLSAPALAILRELRVSSPGTSSWVFPSTSKAGHTTSLHKALVRLQRASGVAFEPHDLRRSVASHLTSMGVSRLTVGKILNHAERGVTAVYDRHSYDPEKRQAIDGWARRLHSIVTGEAASKVVELRRG